jgi:ketosteroid isomerase-like protein
MNAARLEVHETIHAYAVHLDAGRFDRLAELFTEDAVFDIVPGPWFMAVPLHGRDAIVAALAARFEVVRETGGRRHVCSNTITEVISDTEIAAETFLTSIGTSPSAAPELLATGVYADVLRLDGGRWRFASRRLDVDGSIRKDTKEAA